MTVRFEALKLRFLDRCSRDLALLQQQLAAPETVSPMALHTLVHQMSGAAAAFGFLQLGTLAMRLDEEMAAGIPPSRDTVQALIDLLKAM